MKNFMRDDHLVVNKILFSKLWWAGNLSEESRGTVSMVGKKDEAGPISNEMMA